MAEAVTKSESLLKNVVSFVEPGVGIVLAFKGIYDNAKNIKELKNVKTDSKKKSIEDAEKVEAGKKLRNKDQDKLAKDAHSLNVALMEAANDTARQIQYRQILGNVSDAVEKVGDIISAVNPEFSVVGIGTELAVKIFQKGIATASYIMHCINDAAMLKDWFNGAGRSTVERMYEGKKAYESSTTVKVGPMLDEQIKDQKEKEEKPEEHLPMLAGKINKDGIEDAGKYSSDDVKFTRRALGFESNEELNCFMALNMVHSMLFSASDYNTLEEPKMMAKVTMTVLGLEDSIGKTDSDTAMKIYAKLRE